MDAVLTCPCWLCIGNKLEMSATFCRLIHHISCRF